MPYYFECDYCNQRQEAGVFSLDLEDNCTDCGQDLCKICMSEAGRCDDCEKRADAAEDD